MQGFCGDIIFGIVADPEEDGLQWIAFDERHPDDVLETFVEIAIIFLVIGVIVAQFGLTGLIAKGYGAGAWLMFITYCIPMVTLGAYKISKKSKEA